MSKLSIITDIAGNVAKAGLSAAAHGVGKATMAGLGAMGRGEIKLAKAGAEAVKTGAALGVKGAEAGYKAGRFLVKDARAGMSDPRASHNVVGRMAANAKNAVKGTGEWKYATSKYDKDTGKVHHTDAHFSASKKMLAGLIVPGAIVSTMEGVDAMDKRQMGTMTGGVVTSTPKMEKETYGTMNNGGATGDLVFALHANRHG